MKDNEFSIEDYLSGLRNEYGNLLSETEKEKYREAIEGNGLLSFDSNGAIIQVVQPSAIH